MTLSIPKYFGGEVVTDETESTIALITEVVYSKLTGKPFAYRFQMVKPSLNGDQKKLRSIEDFERLFVKRARPSALGSEKDRNY